MTTFKFGPHVCAPPEDQPDAYCESGTMVTGPWDHTALTYTDDLRINPQSVTWVIGFCECPCHEQRYRAVTP